MTNVAISHKKNMHLVNIILVLLRPKFEFFCLKWNLKKIRVISGQMSCLTCKWVGKNPTHFALNFFHQ